MTDATADGLVGAVIVAAGKGERFGDTAKVFADLGGSPVLAHSLMAFAAHPDIARIALVLGEHTMDAGRELIASLNLSNVSVHAGGETRSDSVRAGIIALGHSFGFVAVHDAARPLVTQQIIDRTLAAARETGAAIPVVPVTDTIHRSLPDDSSGGVLNRKLLRAAQTPQVARRDWLLQALAIMGDTTDEGGLLQSAGFPVRLVAGDATNIKITFPEDLSIAATTLSQRERGT